MGCLGKQHSRMACKWGCLLKLSSRRGGNYMSYSKESTNDYYSKENPHSACKLIGEIVIKSLFALPYPFVISGLCAL